MNDDKDYEDVGVEAGFPNEPNTVAVKRNPVENILIKPAKSGIDQKLMKELASAGVKIGDGSGRGRG